MVDVSRDSPGSPRSCKGSEGFLVQLDHRLDKKKRDKDDPFWSQPTFPLLDKSDPPKATRHLNRVVLCGCCKFQCCHSTFGVCEASPAESEKLGIPITWHQHGHCPFLEERGCKFGKDRPVFCRLFPIYIDPERNVLTAIYWTITHCPTPKDFTFQGVDQDGKYVYNKRTGMRGPKINNTQDQIKLDRPLEEFPNILEYNAAALEELFGPAMVDDVRLQLKNLNGRIGGFDLEFSYEDPTRASEENRVVVKGGG